MNQLSRRRMIKLVGGSLLLAGCTTGGGTIQQLTGTLETKSARGPKAVLRKGVKFPQPRPDGSTVPTSSRFYAPRTASSNGVSPAIITNPCNPDETCPPPGGGGTIGGSPPNGVISTGAATAYSWNSQNYTETWNATTDVLVGQMYWSISGTVVSVRLVLPSGDEVTMSLDHSVLNTNGTTTLSNGSVATTNLNAPSWSFTNPNGYSLAVAYASTGAATFTSRYAGGPSGIAGPVTYSAAAGAIGSLTTDALSNRTCMAVAIVAALALALIVAAVIAVCTATAGVLCIAAGIVAAAVIGEAVYLYHQTISQACGGSGG